MSTASRDLEDRAKMTLALVAFAQEMRSRHYRNEQGRRIGGVKPCAECRKPHPCPTYKSASKALGES